MYGTCASSASPATLTSRRSAKSGCGKPPRPGRPAPLARGLIRWSGAGSTRWACCQRCSPVARAEGRTPPPWGGATSTASCCGCARPHRRPPGGPIATGGQRASLRTAPSCSARPGRWACWARWPRPSPSAGVRAGASSTTRSRAVRCRLTSCASSTPSWTCCGPCPAPPVGPRIAALAFSATTPGRRRCSLTCCSRGPGGASGRWPACTWSASTSTNTPRRCSSTTTTRPSGWDAACRWPTRPSPTPSGPSSAG